MEWNLGEEGQAQRDLNYVEKQDNVKITAPSVKKQLKKMASWKSPGSAGLHGYWLKNFTTVHARLVEQLNECLQHKMVPTWMTKGRTVLIIKDKEIGPVATNFRPITCLSLMWKLLTGVMSDEIYQHLESKRLLPSEQKGCRRNSRGTKDQLLIDKMIIRNCKRRLTGLEMAWIDFRKAFDMVPHTWITKCMTMFGVADNMTNLLENSMEQWNTELISGGESLGHVEIKRGIFQGDSLSPLLFILALMPLTIVQRKVKAGYDLGKGNGIINHLLFMDDLKLYGKSEKQIDTLVQSVRIVSSDMCMEFGVSKCAILIMKRGKLAQCDGIQLPDNKRMRSVNESGESYKYLGILEADDIKHQEMKKLIPKEYYRRVRKILQSKLNGGNIVKAVNLRAVSIVRYGAGIIDWKKDELKEMDRKTRKLFSIYRALHPQADVDRLYLKRSEGGRGLLSIEECVIIETNSLVNYIKESNEKVLNAVLFEGILDGNYVGVDKSRLREERRQRYLAKPLHRSTEKNRDDKSWLWLKNGKLKKETEGLIIAAQDQALRTNSIKNRIDKQQVSPACRLCGERDETVSHIVAECKMLAQKYYKSWRHDKVAQVIHWRLCHRFKINREDKWYNHILEPVLESREHKILWDFKIQTDNPIEANKPDIVVFNKESKDCYIIDIACPFDTRIDHKTKEKLEKYQDLRRIKTSLEVQDS